MTSRRNNELGGGFSDNWRSRRNGGSRTAGFADIVGAIAFMADTQIAQVQLAALGYKPGTADGKLGPVTSAELTKFQGNEGLPKTGTLDDATKQKLYLRTAGMGLKLPSGTPIVAPVMQGTNNGGGNAAASAADLLGIPLTPTLDFPTATMPGFPAAPGGTTTPAIPGMGPGTPVQAGTPPQVQPGSPGSANAAVPTEATIFGMPRMTGFAVIGLAGGLLAAGGYYAWKKNQEPETLRMTQRSVGPAASAPDLRYTKPTGF